LNTEPIGYPETPARNYQNTLNNYPEELKIERICKQQIISPTSTECMEERTTLKHDLAQLGDSTSIYLFGNEAQQDALADWRISFICLLNSTRYSTRVAPPTFFISFSLLNI
jgi:hypothetical protein